MTKSKKLSLSEKIIIISEHGNFEEIKTLIAQSKNIAECSEALLTYAQSGNAELVNLLIPMSYPTSNNNYALRLASKNGHTECVKLLIPVSDPKDSNALWWAAADNRYECVKLLLKHSNPSSWIKRDWEVISYDMQNFIKSFFSRVSLEKNISISKNKISKIKKSRKI